MNVVTVITQRPHTVSLHGSSGVPSPRCQSQYKRFLIKTFSIIWTISCDDSPFYGPGSRGPCDGDLLHVPIRQQQDATSYNASCVRFIKLLFSSQTGSLTVYADLAREGHLEGSGRPAGPTSGPQEMTWSEPTCYH